MSILFRKHFFNRVSVLKEENQQNYVNVQVVDMEKDENDRDLWLERVKNCSYLPKMVLVDLCVRNYLLLLLRVVL